MNIKIWCKSFLSIYHIIPTLINSIDKLVYLKSINSSNFHNFIKDDTYGQINGISSLIQKKINLINLKVLTEETLLEMDKDKKKLIVFKYIDNLDSKKAIELSGMPRRSYFRALKNALVEFEKIFYLKVLKNEKIYNSFNQDLFFEEVFEKINNIDIKEDCSSFEMSKQICKYIVNKMKKVC